jgi:hypothetical protein
LISPHSICNEHTCADALLSATTPSHYGVINLISHFISGLESIHELSKGHLRSREEDTEPSLDFIVLDCTPRNPLEYDS